MREILFRGKRKNNGEWIEGCLLNFRENTYIIPHDSEYCYDDTEKLAFDVEYFEVLPETVGQYTDWTDKNGKKIFEGDIIKEKSFYTRPYKVYWENDFSGFYPFDMEEAGIGNVIEILGNIHDNPELPKGKSK